MKSKILLISGENEFSSKMMFIDDCSIIQIDPKTKNLESKIVGENPDVFIFSSPSTETVGLDILKNLRSTNNYTPFVFVSSNLNLKSQIHNQVLAILIHDPNELNQIPSLVQEFIRYELHLNQIRAN